MTTYYLAVDIGASSGRHILGSVIDGKLCLEEIYRFENGMSKKDGELCWDIDSLFKEIKNGLKECKRLNKVPVSMGIDTWAVDFVLLDKNNKVLGNTVGYRDSRTDGMDKKVYEKISLPDLYKRTGIQKLIFNSIYQLMAIKQNHPEYLENATDFIMIPDYFNFLLTGNKFTEYTNATTTQLVSPTTKDWDFEIIEKLGYNKDIFKPISMPGTVVGHLTDEVIKEIGFSKEDAKLEVVLPATHDTGSAVLSVPALNDDFLYISSGTWSLMGIERKEADCSIESMNANFTNEGGYEYRFRYLKNIMGLWMIQSVRHELNDEYSFAKLCELAEENTDFPSRVDVNDNVFLAPDSMIEAIKTYCKNTNQQVPQNVGQIATVIYQSLADSYADTVKEIETLTHKTYSSINIVGGGCNADYLNKLTAKSTQKTIYAGPTEATAIGNLVAQMINTSHSDTASNTENKRITGEFSSVEDARQAIYNSFPIKKY